MVHARAVHEPQQPVAKQLGDVDGRLVGREGEATRMSHAPQRQRLKQLRVRRDPVRRAVGALEGRLAQRPRVDKEDVARAVRDDGGGPTERFRLILLHQRLQLPRLAGAEQPPVRQVTDVQTP